MLELERPDSLVQRVVGALRAEIDAGHFPAESRLPTEQQLSERLNVSRSVVREAIAQLKSDGVLVARRGAGSFISQTPSGTVFRLPSGGKQKLDLAQLFEMRLWIETQAAMTAARRRTPEDLKRMSDAIREMEKKRLDFDAASAADVAFHRAVAAATKNEYFVAFHDFLRGQLVAVRRAQWANTASCTRPSSGATLGPLPNRLSGICARQPNARKSSYPPATDDSGQAGQTVEGHVLTSAIRFSFFTYLVRQPDKRTRKRLASWIRKEA
jgi:DNA-binding FadR family transcriptional regulator